LRIIVTGGAGFIGTHLTRELENSGHQVNVWDHAVSSGQNLFYIDNFRNIMKSLQPDMVVHLAAKVGRMFGEDDLRRTIDDNAAMTALVAQACGEFGVRLVYASTSEIYGDNGYDLCDEEEGPFSLPHNAYGLSKRQGEEYCRLYAPDGLTIWRISMPYGPGLPAGRGRAAMINFLYNALHEQYLTVHKKSERSWCWIGDTTRAMRMTIELTEGGTFNIGRDDNPTTMKRVAKMACGLAGVGRDLIVDIDPPERQTVVKRLATERIRSLGWEPHVELDEGMRRTFEWVKTLDAPGVAAAA
jgi:nucleoside-diphosphate-sugar epimerase